MDNPGRVEIMHSQKMRAGKRRTYFFDIRKTKGEDFYISISESIKKFQGDGFERHKIFIYKEDFNRFVENLEQIVNEIKTKYLPDFDYDSYSKREPWGDDVQQSNDSSEIIAADSKDSIEEDMKW